MTEKPFTCERVGCNQHHENFSGYCSSDCYNLALRIFAERVDSMYQKSREEILYEITDTRQHASRWTPQTMQRHIEELKARA